MHNRIINRVLNKALMFYHHYLNRHQQVMGKILMMHRIGGIEQTYNITIEAFEFLVRELSKKNVIHLKDFEREKDFIALTFDDVSVSFYNNAYPLLEKYKIPYTIFVNLSLLDTDRHISTAQLKEMANSPLCTVGSHGMKHTQFALYAKHEAEEDLKRSKVELESIIGKDVSLYAFPYGSYYACGLKNPKMVNKYYRYGFSAVNLPITTNRLFPNYFIPRMNVTMDNYQIIFKNEDRLISRLWMAV